MNGAIRNNPNHATTARNTTLRPEHRSLLVEALRTYSTGRGLPPTLPQPLTDQLERTLGALRANARVQYGRFLRDLAAVLEDPRMPRPDLLVDRRALLQLHTWWASDPGYLAAFARLAQDLPHPIGIPAFWEGLLQHRDAAGAYCARLAALRALPEADAFLHTLRRCCTDGVYQRFLADGHWDTLHRIWQEMPGLFAHPEGPVNEAHLSTKSGAAASIAEALAGHALPPTFSILFDRLNEQEIGWCCHLLKDGSIATLPGLHFRVSPDAAARFAADNGTTHYHEEPRVVTHLFAAALAAQGVPDAVVRLAARFIHRLTARTAPQWTVICKVLGRMDAAALVPGMMEQPSSLSSMRSFLCGLERCCTPEVFRGVFREGQHRWIYGLWKQAPELFALPATGPIVEGPHGSAYAIIEAIMGRRILPEAFLFALKGHLGKPAADSKPLMLHDGPLSTLETGWMVHMLKGGSIKNAPGLPFALSKGTPHLFNVQPLQLPYADYVRQQRIVWRHLVMAEFIACGGQPLLAELAADLVAGQDLDRCVPVLQELIRKGYQRGRIQVVFDFLRAPGCTIGLDELRGMTTRSLDRRVEEWHEELSARMTNVSKRPFPDRRIPPYHTEVNGREYRIVQVQNAKELFVEGQQLHHCVVSYARECSDGHAAIFSLRRSVPGREQRLVTIQVSGGAVMQAKGPCNREPNELETQILNEWVAANRNEIPHGIRWY